MFELAIWQKQFLKNFTDMRIAKSGRGIISNKSYHMKEF